MITGGGGQEEILGIRAREGTGRDERARRKASAYADYFPLCIINWRVVNCLEIVYDSIRAVLAVLA